MGNICRSPTAEAVMRARATELAPWLNVTIDSAGTHGYHVGDPPDSRSQAAARRRGIDLSRLRARRLVANDFHAFDYVLVMDERNLRDAQAIAPSDGRARLQLFLDYANEAGIREVPDPYYGSAADFERVLDLVEAAARGLVDHLLSLHPRRPGG
jgi:protein-tyrosine phosphatase